MNPVSQPGLDPSAEVAALVQTLRNAEERLTALAGGELDSVADASGQTFLLQHAQEQLRRDAAANRAAILNALDDHIALLDTQGVIVLVNDVWRDYTGNNPLLTEEHRIGENYLDACDRVEGADSAVAKQAAAAIRGVLAGHQTSDVVEYPCSTPAAKSWFMLKVMPLPGSPPQGAVVMHIDVTAERLAQEKQRRSEKRFRQMAENIRDVFFLIDVATAQILYISPAYEQTWGRSCESLYAEPASWLQAIHPDDRANAIEGFEQGVIAGAFELDYRIVRPDGTIRWIESKAFPIQDSAGNYVRITGICIDVTERKQASILVGESQQRLALATRSAGIGIWDWTIAGDRMVWDTQMYALYGIQEQDFGGAYHAWQQGLHPEDRARAQTELAVALAGGDAFDTEFRVVWPSGEVRNIEAHASVQRAADGAAERMIGVNWDITERKQSEIRINYLNRVYAVLSGINLLIARVRTLADLFEEACAIAVRDGGFRIALIGSLDAATSRIVPVAAAGMPQPMLEKIAAFCSSDAGALTGGSLVARVVRDQRAFVSNDSEHDPEVIFGDDYAQAGVRSLAMLPLLHGDCVIGVLSLFAGEVNFFHEDEMRLLEELAADIAFGIDHIEKQDRLNYLAYYDTLTGLANHSLFMDRLAQSVYVRDGDSRLIATVFLDLERFRQVNDTLGRGAGDQLLREIGARLHGANDSVARIGGDVFGLILRCEPSMVSVHEALTKLLAHCFDQPFMLPDGEEFYLTCSAGIALFPADGTDADALMRNAEAALRQSKISGERIEFYARAMNAEVAEALAMEARLRRAIERHEFVVHYQPKWSLADDRMVGAEALIRWIDPIRGLVSPALFIPILVRMGLINEVGRWVVRQAFADLGSWAARGASVPRIAVNVSALQLARKDFVEGISEEIAQGGECPHWLELEITEGIVMGDFEDSSRKLSTLRAMGVTIAIDDFGTGYSSLSYLARLPVDALKVDQSFVAGMTDSTEAASIVSTIIALAHSLKLRVVAEGVETQAQANMLRQLGCDQAQGHLFSMALPAATFAERYLQLQPQAD